MWKLAKGVPVHGKFHLFFVIGNRGVDILELQADFRAHVPAER